MVSLAIRLCTKHFVNSEEETSFYQGESGKASKRTLHLSLVGRVKEELDQGLRGEDVHDREREIQR